MQPCGDSDTGDITSGRFSQIGFMEEVEVEMTLEVSHLDT